MFGYMGLLFSIKNTLARFVKMVQNQAVQDRRHAYAPITVVRLHQTGAARVLANASIVPVEKCTMQLQESVSALRQVVLALPAAIIVPPATTV